MQKISLGKSEHARSEFWSALELQFLSIDKTSTNDFRYFLTKQEIRVNDADLVYHGLP